MTTATSNPVTELKPYPNGVFVMFFLQALMMVGFMFIFSLLVLNLTKELGFSDKSAYAISAAYNALVFAISVAGGYLAERFTGYRLATTYSIILTIIGLFLLVLQTKAALYLGLGFFIMGNATFVPCTYVLLGRLYGKNDSRRTSGFTIAYVGMNMGAFLAGAVAGPLQKYWGFDTTFFIGALVGILLLVFFMLVSGKFNARKEVSDIAHKYPHTPLSRFVGLALITLCVPILAILVNYATLCNILLISAGILAALLIVILALREPPQARKRMFSFLILTLIAVAFWSLYMLSPSVMIIFSEHNVNRHILGHVLPTPDVLSFNPFFIITLGPLLSLFWIYLSKRGKIVATSTKFGMGVTLMGVGYLVLMTGVYFHTPLGYTMLWWVFLSYFFQTTGELFVGPVGYSMVGELVPAHYEGLMMGIWQLATGVAGAISEFLAQMTVTPKAHHNPLLSNPAYSHSFALYGGITLAIGIVALALVPFIKRISGHSERLAAVAIS